MRKIIPIIFFILFLLAASGCPSGQPAQTQDEKTETQSGNPADDPAFQDAVDKLHEIPKDVDTTYVVDEKTGELKQVTKPIDPGIGGDDELYMTSRTNGIPPGWPDEVPVIDGFVVSEGTVESNKQGKSRYIITALGAKSYVEVEEFYRALEGWKIEGEAVSENQSFMMGLSKGKSTLTITTRIEKDNVVLTLSYVEDLKAKVIEETAPE